MRSMAKGWSVYRDFSGTSLVDEFDVLEPAVSLFFVTFNILQVKEELLVSTCTV
jgi:hypothetical protein